MHSKIHLYISSLYKFSINKFYNVLHYSKFISSLSAGLSFVCCFFFFSPVFVDLTVKREDLIAVEQRLKFSVS